MAFESIFTLYKYMHKKSMKDHFITTDIKQILIDITDNVWIVKKIL